MTASVLVVVVAHSNDDDDDDEGIKRLKWPRMINNQSDIFKVTKKQTILERTQHTPKRNESSSSQAQLVKRALERVNWNFKTDIFQTKNVAYELGAASPRKNWMITSDGRVHSVRREEIN